MTDKIAVVTGASKGLGFVIVKLLCQRYDGIVYLTSKVEKSGIAAVEKLNELGLKPHYHQLDISDSNSVQNFADYLKNKYGGLDVLVNNASIFIKDEVYPSYEAAKKTIDVNYRSLLIIEKYLYPLLRDGARVVNVSSACGHLSNIKQKSWIRTMQDSDLTTEQINQFVNEYLESIKNGTFNKNDYADDGKHAEQRVSKIALTALTKVQQRKYGDMNISINAINPGHIALIDEAYGGGDAELEQSAELIMYLIFDASPKLRGTFMWDNRGIIDWYDAEADFSCKSPW